MTILAVEDVTPLYKILCITLLIIAPLVPAYILYKIAPKNRFLAKGNFSGFSVNATGAVGMYIVIFATVYPKMDGIMTTIDKDRSDGLQAQISMLQDSTRKLLDKMPWKVQCKLTLLGANKAELNNDDYYTYLNPDNIRAFPLPLSSDVRTRMVSFYIDDNVLKEDSNSCSLVFANGSFGATKILIDDKCKDNTTKRITIAAQCSRNSNDPSLRRNDPQAAIDSSHALRTPPSVPI